jgi:hypothetical protein
MKSCHIPLQGPAFLHKADDTDPEINRRVFLRRSAVLAAGFAPVKARHVRLNILKANEVPTVEEFQVFAPVPK